MNVALWIVQVVLALAFAFSGLSKLIQPRDRLAARGMGYVEDFSPLAIKLIGAAEVLGAIGLVFPAWTGIAPILTPIAAVGLMVVMVGAAITHLRRGEAKDVAPSIVLFVLAAFIAWGRFGPYSF